MNPAEVVNIVITDLVDNYSELNDDPDSLFGKYARVGYLGYEDNQITVLHQNKPFGVRIIIEYIEEKG